jgi:hypothetical protein
MQALIDFDGWRKWKDFADSNGLKNASNMPTGLSALKKSTSPNPSPVPPTSPPQKKLSSAAAIDGGAVKPVDSKLENGTAVNGDGDGDKTPAAPTAALGVRPVGAAESTLVKEDSPDTIVEVDRAPEADADNAR